MAIDSHAHYNNLLQADLKECIFKINGDDSLDAIINVGLDVDTSVESKNIALKNKKFYSAIGIHPLYIKNKYDIEKLIDIYNNDDNIVAIGEIGLDSTNDNLDRQIYFFKHQIEIANYLKLPVIIHSKNMNHEIIEIFKHSLKPEYGCVFHCFQPDIEVLSELVRLGYYVSFGGPITFKMAKKSHEVLLAAPIDKILVETDSPYLTPEPYRSQINSSLYLKYIVEKIAEVKKMSYEDIENITSTNTKTLFKKMK